MVDVGCWLMDRDVLNDAILNITTVEKEMGEKTNSPKQGKRRFNFDSIPSIRSTTTILSYFLSLGFSRDVSLFRVEHKSFHWGGCLIVSPLKYFSFRKTDERARCKIGRRNGWCGNERRYTHENTYLACDSTSKY
jgi:hypothetical protein